MTRRFVAGFVGIGLMVLGAGGCACCRNRAQYDSLATDDAVETCATTRNDIYTFVVGGADPFDGGSDRLAKGLNDHGFAKVYAGTRFHVGWFGREAKRVAEGNPDVRFVVVGRRGGTGSAEALANKLATEGRSVDAFILIQPDIEPVATSSGRPFETVTFHSEDEASEVRSVATFLTGIARQARPEALARVVRPLVDDPAPAPEAVVTGHSAVPR